MKPWWTCSSLSPGSPRTSSQPGSAFPLLGSLRLSAATPSKPSLQRGGGRAAGGVGGGGGRRGGGGCGGGGGGGGGRGGGGGGGPRGGGGGGGPGGGRGCRPRGAKAHQCEASERAVRAHVFLSYPPDRQD